MTKQFTQNIFESTYRDDYRDSDNFHRILFNNGRPGQAREFTQLQTIIQKEITRFGKNIFKEGAAVNPGGVTVNNAFEFIKLNTSLNVIPNDVTDLIGVSFTSQSGIVFEVIEVVEPTSSDPATIYGAYKNTTSGTSGETAIRVAPGEILSGGGFTLTVQSTNTIANPAVGVGTRVSIHAGDFFTQGRFVFARDQSLIIDKYDSAPNADIGFKVTQDIVTASDDDRLYDNSGATPNRAAPGADRYRIRLEIANKDDLDSDENFVHVVKIVNGAIVSQVTAVDDYNKINDLLALRTKEESGDYIVKPFKLKFDTNDSDESILDFDISAGTAYVQGYRAASFSPISLPVVKPRTTAIENNEVVAANYGNYVVCSADGDGLPNVDSLQQWNMKDGTNYGGSIIGTARIRAVEEDGSNFRVYLFDITMNAGENRRNVKSIGNSSTSFMNLVLENNKAVFKDTHLNNLLFKLPKTRPQSLSDISLTVQRRFTTASDGSGNANVSLTNSGETFADTNAWIIGHSGGIENASVTGAGTQSASISGLTPNIGTEEILAYVNKSEGNIRSKTLNEITSVITPDSDGNISFAHADIYEVIRISDTDSDGSSLASRYTVDNGQRDNSYELGSLQLKGGQTAPTGSVFVRYKYFSHGSSGDFFGVNSYTGQVDYEDIPSHTLADGTVVNLRDYLDFRPVKNSSNNYVGSTARVNELPQNTQLITADVNYYLPVNVKVVIDIDGEISTVVGEPSFTPQFPLTPSNSLELFSVRMNPYVINDADLSYTPAYAKHYSMADIGRLDRRLSNLEELTSLSLLELETSSFSVLDELGNNRTKSGFFVDNFADQLRAFTVSPEYRASIDPLKKVARPWFAENNIRMIYKSGDSVNTVKKGDNVYMNYGHESYIDQPLATTTENVNPFAVIVNEGFLELSPASDEWKEIRYNAALLRDGGVRFDTDQALLWDQWRWNWIGTDATEDPSTLQAGDILGQNVDSGRRRFFGLIGGGRTETIDRVVSNEVIVEVIDDRILDVALIPFMRSRKIQFRAQGLKPNTQVFPFFNNKPVAEWCREETFTRFSDNEQEYGNEYANATEHPETKSDLITNSEGTVTGSFFIPSTDNIKFRTGQREFKLLDISVPNDENATSIARALFSSQGILETRQETHLSTRVVTVAGSTRRRRRRIDPLAQSFMVDDDSGIFITKVNVRFKTKSDAAPVVVQIRPTVNGAPSSDDIVPGAIKFLSPSAVSTSDDATAITSFEFDEPVYLNPFTEYAIVVLSDSVDYNLYVAEAGEFLLGSTEKRVTRQPTLGSLFKSQNGVTWEPDQTKDMTFELERAKFDIDNETYIIVENASPAKEQLREDPFISTNGSSIVYVEFLGHGFTVGDVVNIYGAEDGTGILATAINTQQTVLSVDGFGFTFDCGDTASESAFFGGANVTMTRNIMFDTVIPYVENIVPPYTAMNFTGKFTTGRSFAGIETAYQKADDFSTIFIKENNTFNAPRMIASLENEANNLGGERSATVKIIMQSGSDKVTPVVDMQRVSLGLISNLIDRQAASDAAGFNVPSAYVAETDASQGTHLAKHITQPIVLAETAVGMKVMFAANRPAAAGIDLYYRVNDGETGNILTNPWIKGEIETDMPSDENTTVFRDYRYLIGGQDGSLDAFDQFQLKIVFTSTNSSKVPVLQDLRAIALSV